VYSFPAICSKWTCRLIASFRFGRYDLGAGKVHGIMEKERVSFSRA
jgi:hypothetical protein